MVNGRFTRGGWLVPGTIATIMLGDAQAATAAMIFAALVSQVAEPADWHRILIRKEPIVRYKADLGAPLHRLEAAGVVVYTAWRHLALKVARSNRRESDRGTL